MSDSAANPPTPMPFGMPAEIGGYRIQRVLGSGGMATVYAALQQQPRRTVAVKVIKTGVESDSALHRFKREIEILGRLRHPYIAQVYDAGVHETSPGGGGPVPFFVMEYVSGAKTILEYIAAKQLEQRERLKLFVKVCAAVEHGHRNKVIHRDLKPSNILIDQFGEPKVIDFGVAQAADIDLGQTMQTEAGRLVGTLQYMSPEQVDGTRQDINARCDVYALGALLYKILTGRHVHDLEGLTVYEALHVIREERPPKPSEIKPELSGDLETIILKAIEPDRQRRYRDAGSFGRDLVRFLADKPIHARRASFLHRARLFGKRHRAVLTAGAVAGSVMLIAGAIVVAVMLDARRNQTADAGSSPSQSDKLDQMQAVIDTLKQRTNAPPPRVEAPEAFTFDAHVGRVSRLAFSPNGQMLASGGADHALLLWDLEKRERVADFREIRGAIEHVQFIGDGSELAVASADGPVFILNAPDAAVQRTVPARFGEIDAIAISADGAKLALACADLTIRMFDLNSIGRDDPITLRSTAGRFNRLSFDGSGSKLAAGAASGAVFAWQVSPAQLLNRWSVLDRPIEALTFVTGSAQNLFIVAVAENGQAAAWPIDNSMPATPFAACEGNITAAAVDPAARWLAVSSGQSISVWDLTTFAMSASQRALIEWVPQPHTTWACDSPPCALAIDAAARRCAWGQTDGRIQIRAFDR